jgi:cbb3-type cytochrome oxidase subunit 3
MYTLFASGEFGEALTLIKQFGPFFLAVVFFLWRDWRREDRLSNRLDELEDEQREVILPLVKDCSTVIAKNTAVMERLERFLDR